MKERGERGEGIGGREKEGVREKHVELKRSSEFKETERVRALVLPHNKGRGNSNIGDTSASTQTLRMCRATMPHTLTPSPWSAHALRLHQT